VLAVRDEGRTYQAPPCPEPHLGGELIPGEADQAGRSKRPEVRELLGVEEALDGLVQRHAGRHEDRSDDRQTRDLLGPEASQ
jgi:hypothetical protein